MIIAITGCIGSGKSYILKLINECFNYDVFSSDEFVKEAYENETIKRKLDKHFKCLINDKVDKQIIKSKLNESNISLLNSIIHPYVKEKIIHLADLYSNTLAFIEVPLLFESNMDSLFDYSIMVSTNDDIRHQKLFERDPKNYQNMLNLEKFQLNNNEKKQKSTFIIESNFNKQENIIQLYKIIEAINK